MSRSEGTESASGKSTMTDNSRSVEVRCFQCGKLRRPGLDGFMSDAGKYLCGLECVLKAYRGDILLDCQDCGLELGCHSCDGCGSE